MRRLFANDAPEQAGHGRGGEGDVARQAFVHGRAQTVEVRARVDVRIARSLLGGDVARRAEDAATLLGLLFLAREVGRTHAEVEQRHQELTVGPAIEHHVFGLHVAMDVAQVVSAMQDRGDA